MSRHAAARDEVTIRAVRPTDRDALRAYFSRLPEDDRRLRFFVATSVDEHVDRFLAAEDTDRLVAVLEDAGSADGARRCVGEAMGAPCGDGVAEFAVSVERDRRGGLGTALFEELRRRAAARGITTLFGDVLARNTAMLGLLRRRGGVVIERPTPDRVGVIVGTRPGAPSWPSGSVGRRVLIEASEGGWHGEDELRAAGLEVAVCEGPGARAPDAPCPVLVGESCPLVEGADVVVHLLTAQVAANQAVAAALEVGWPTRTVLAPRSAQERDDLGAVAVHRVLAARGA